MHMADVLISPAVCGTIWAASAGLIAYCSKKVRDDVDDHQIPLMCVAGAFIFAAQMSRSFSMDMSKHCWFFSDILRYN